MDYTCNNMVTEATPPSLYSTWPLPLGIFWYLKEFI